MKCASCLEQLATLVAAQEAVYHPWYRDALQLLIDELPCVYADGEVADGDCPFV